ncbi:circadian clock protein KaiC [Zeaxanthinibacter enoshimensis]|uniref:circadian clock protein KaiC n=1 Tax=Zeaxanthinibacter enoshimensis TaxID=392009 RepID=UPI0035678351
MTESSTDKFPKTASGINGLDEIMQGGFPSGRPVLICGGPGCGKTLFSVQFLVNGITEHDEPGVFMSFEESAKDLSLNVKSLGFDLEELQESGKLKVDHVHIERSEIEETGEFDLEALFIRLNHAIDSIGAKRVVLDTVEALFGGIDNDGILRAELRRLFSWLKKKGVTTVITGERGKQSFTRQGLEEYVSDCVILLDFRVIDQIATRRLRIVKYRGSMHGTNEYPFLINEKGISVIPVTSLNLTYGSSTEVVSTGLEQLDESLDQGGLYRGSSVLITGSAGTSKTILAAHFAMASINREEPVLFFSFEESPEQLIRNMDSIGIDFRTHLESGLLHIQASRPSLQGLEMHLIRFYNALEELKPKTVIVDPISSLITIGSSSEVRAMLIRLLDTLKNKQINAVFTALTQANFKDKGDLTVEAISSLSDAWIDLNNNRKNRRQNRTMRIVKARGMGHNPEAQEFRITDRGFHFSLPTEQMTDTTN